MVREGGEKEEQSFCAQAFQSLQRSVSPREPQAYAEDAYFFRSVLI